MDYYSANDLGYGRPNHYTSRATRSPSQSRVLAEDKWPNHEDLGSWPRTRGVTESFHTGRECAYLAIGDLNFNFLNQGFLDAIVVENASDLQLNKAGAILRPTVAS
nr:hypothetical protein Iba_chr15aCG10920 [Ipomoea batatas]